jgi:nitrous oxidase accessory protein NosD
MSLENFHMEKEVSLDTIFPLIYAEHVNDVCVEDLVLDGNGENNLHCNGNYSGAVFAQFCHRWQFRNVIARNYNGDGFSFQASDDFTFENCLAVNNTDLGFHPGSGAQRPKFTDCKSLENGQGFFFCWNVNDGVVEKCESSRNREYGFSFGHRDSDNIVRNCQIAENGEAGILFREDPGEERTADRNRIEECCMRDNGSKAKGLAIAIDDASDGTVIRNNRIEFTHPEGSHTGIRIGRKVKGCELAGNTFAGCDVDVEDLRSDRQEGR